MGTAIAKTAEILGYKLTPAQRYINDVAHELLPETNTLAYTTVVVVLHRQGGKTLITLPRLVTKARRWENLRFAYTAQDLNHAVAKVKEDFLPILRRCDALKEGRDWSWFGQNGQERLTIGSSLLSLSATGTKSGHGKTLDEAVVDEAMAHQDTRVDAGFGVPMITRGKAARDSMGKVTPGPQKWIISNRGDESAVYLDHYVEMGRNAVEQDVDRGLCYIEWSKLPDVDHTDPATWWYFITSLGHTIDEADILTELQTLDTDDWLRAYGNVPQVRKKSAEAAIDIDAWERQTDTDSEMEGRLVLGLAMKPDRSQVAVGAAGFRSDGDVHIECTKHGSGTGWVVDHLARVVERHDVAQVAIDAGGPAASLIPAVEERGLPLRKLSGREYAAACGLVYDRLDEGRLWHLNQPMLWDAVVGAKWRPLGDARAWDRRVNEADITPLEATTVAYSALLSLPEEEPPKESVYAERGLFSWDQ